MTILFQTFINNTNTIINCIKVCIEVLWLFPIIKRVGIIIVPIISSLLNIHINNILLDTNSDIINCILFKGLYDYISLFVINNVFYNQVRIMNDALQLRLNMAKIHCGTPIPGINQKQYKDLTDDSSKLRDFLFVIPMLWSSIINFCISIYFMGPNVLSESNSLIYPIRFMFFVACIIMCGVLSYMTDASLYEKTKPSSNSVTKFEDSSYVKMKLSMGCVMDTKHEINKKNKISKQQDVQKYVVIIMNLIITYISLINKNIGQFHSFGNISWMLSCLADNIKSLQYYTYINEFITLIHCFENHKLYSTNLIPVGMIDSVNFINASFGYYSDLNKSITEQKIFNLTYTFNNNMFYYLEAPNGIGKSTMLKMFTSNLFSGEVFFGSVNRKNLSFNDVASSVFHIVQASEYTPKFSKEEVSAYKGRNEWLEERLGLYELFEKDTVEMSGGQKKRMFIYMVLTSNAPILLLDEILSELSTEETPDVPEGGGWLSRVINTMVEWKNHNKIIIMVGHGLLELMPKKSHVINLKMETINNNTVLVKRD